LPEPDEGGTVIKSKGAKAKEISFNTKEEMDAYDR
jgi:hypothetical protein